MGGSKDKSVLSMVQLTTKFTLACTIHSCVFQFYSRDQLELMCHTRVILRALHSSHTSSATRESYMACCTRVRLCVLHESQTSCAALESYFECYMRVIHGVLHGVRLCVLHESQTSCAARESNFVCYTRVSVRILCTYVSLQTEYQTHE